jgi:hypothetical protein
MPAPARRDSTQVQFTRDLDVAEPQGYLFPFWAYAHRARDLTPWESQQGARLGSRCGDAYVVAIPE